MEENCEKQWLSDSKIANSRSINMFLFFTFILNFLLFKKIYVNLFLFFLF